MKCNGKAAIVTGAAGNGMGRSIALTLARESAKVIVNYRTSRESVTDIVHYIKNCDGYAAAVQADIFTPEGCQNLVDATVERYGQVDICIVGPGADWNPDPIDKLNPATAADVAHRRNLCPGNPPTQQRIASRLSNHKR